MRIEKGSRLGPFEILGPLGAGGMGEVYRATDTRLGRDVAIKALPDEFSRDPERLARFEREARLLASLQHANIAAIHGLEIVDGHRYLVLECVEGETLAERIRRGAISVDETVDIGHGVAAALEAAHERGIVHRDLKPGNVMLTGADVVKVLDFGLAKGADPAGSASDPGLSASPTLTYNPTEPGLILGTAAYMSPEQARGRAVDRRTDIWSFGCLLFECLTGRQAFAGESVSDTLANILQSEPAWTTLPANTPERLRGLLRRCLEKDLKRRLRDIGDARIELEDLQAMRESNRVARAAVVSRGLDRSRVWAAVAATAVIAGAGAWFAARAWNPAPAARPIRFEIAGPKHHELIQDAVSVAMSPDGRTIAMIATDSSFASSIWIRPIDSLTPRELPGTRNATLMFWSPDSRFLAFFAGDEALWKIAIAGGEPERICDVKVARGGAWGPNGVILLAPNPNGGIYRVSANGGDLVEITRPDSARGETGNRFPCFLPDGKHFLFAGVPVGDDAKFGLYVGSIDGGAPQPLGRFESGAVYCDPGWLLTTRGNALVAQRFDAGARRLIGEPVALGDAPSVIANYSGSPRVSASRTGAVAYLTRVVPPQRMAWMDLAGHETAIPGLAAGLNFDAKVSPDGRRALVSGVSENFTLYVSLVDLERGTVSRLTPAPENSGNAVWSPDGRRIAYLKGSTTLIVRTLGDGSTRTYLESDHSYKDLQEWSRDGKYLVFDRLDHATKWDVWLLPVDGEGAPIAAARSDANERQGRLSPDGRWIAFTSDETGVPETYVQAVGSSGLKYQVTTGGGGPWYWSRDGKSLVFQRSDQANALYRSAVRASEEFALGPPSEFVRLPENLTYGFPDFDEKRFLILRPAEKPERQTLTVLQNWQAALQKP